MYHGPYIGSFCRRIAARLYVRINWVATFRLLEEEAGNATYKEFIHVDLVSAMNLGKNVLKSLYTIASHNCIHIGWKTAYKITYLGFCKMNYTDDNMIQMKIVHTCIY